MYYLHFYLILESPFTKKRIHPIGGRTLVSIGTIWEILKTELHNLSGNNTEGKTFQHQGLNHPITNDPRHCSPHMLNIPLNLNLHHLLVKTQAI
jgi:hypothetical protein